MRYSTMIAALAFATLPDVVAAKACVPAFLSGDQSVTITGVDIEPGAVASQNFQLRIHNAAGGGSEKAPALGGGPCDATIRLVRTALAADPSFPAYSIRAPGSRQIEILPDPAVGGTVDSDVVIANAPSGPQGRAVPMRLDVATEWGLRAGTYTEQLIVLLLDANGEEVDRSFLTITIQIPPSVSIRFFGAIIGDGKSGPAKIDMGTLSSTAPTQSDRFGAIIFSTSPYIVRFTSANEGTLVRQNGTDRMPYELFFDGSRVDLAGANEFPYFNPTPKFGDRRPMSIIVPPKVSTAGRYGDRITATVTAM